MKKVLSLLLAVLMVVGMFPMTAFAADIPEELNIVELPGVSAFEQGEVIEYTKWGMSGYSTQTYIATVPAGTEEIQVTFKAGTVAIYSDKLSGGWMTYDAENGTYDMGGKDLTYTDNGGNPAITLNVKEMVENGSLYVKYNTYYGEEYALGFKYEEASAEIPEELNIVELPGVSAFEQGEVIEYTKWGMSGYSTQTYIATVPAGTEEIQVTFKAGTVAIYSDKLSGGWMTYDAENGTYDMGGKDLTYTDNGGNPAITLNVKEMVENGSLYVKYNTYYGEEYALGFKYGEAADNGEEEVIPEGVAVIKLSTDVEKISVGDKFKVTAELSGNEGFAAMTLKLNWNSRNVEFLGFDVVEEDGEEFLDSEVFPASYNPVYNQEKGTIAVARSKNSTKNGVMFVANFEVIGNGETGIGLKKDYPDFLYKTADGEDVEVYISEKDVASLGARVAAESITLDKTEVSIEEGSSTLIKATVTPADASDPVVFTSSDETVATVTSGGSITGVKPGNATITVTAGEVSATCEVTVNPEENIISKAETNYSESIPSVMTGVKSINYKGETLEIRNLYKVTIAGHEEFYLRNSRSDWSNCYAAYKLDGTLFGGDPTWGSDFSGAKFNGSYGYQTREIIVSYDEVKAAVGEENIDKLGISETDKLAFLVFEKVSASFDYAVLFVIEPVELVGISIDKTAEIDKGATKDLVVSPNPAGADIEGTVIWTSSDESVATVDENGKVTAVENGTAIITATVGELSAECEVTVRTQIKGIPSNGDYRGNVTNITVQGVIVDNYEWEDKTVTVFVDKDTNATATVKIYWFHDYNQGRTDAFEVEIKNGEGIFDEFHEYGDWVIKFAPTTPTTVLTVESEMNLAISEEKTLTVSRNEGASDAIIWSSSDETVATVDENGKVKGLKEGEAIITVKAGDLEATCKVTVSYVKAESVKIECEGLENGKLRIKKGDYRYLEAVTTPGFVNDEAVWTTSATDTSVINWRDWAAYFTAEGEGAVTVTVTVGEATDTIEVEVYEIKAESIAFEETEVELYTGESYKTKVTVTPEDHSDGRPTYTSSDESVATVNTTGQITTVAAGKATITAKLGELEATCEVTVKDPDEKHVLFKGEGTVWPDYMSTYQVKYILIDNMEIESVTNEGDVYTVTLPHATAKDAEIKLTAIGSGTIAVNWHDGEEGPASWDGYENTFKHSFNLSDGEATVKIRGYKDPGAAGASREKTKTFKFVIGGECVFDQEVADEKYLASEATCTEAAEYYKSCVCGEAGTETFSVGEALGHDEVAHEAKEATCTEIGWEAYVTCSRCDYSTYTEIAALGHDEVAHEAKEATCTEAGWAEYVTCSRCDYTTFDEIEALGHDMTDATCTEPAKCSRCDYTEGEALGHSYKYETVKEPTCSEAGERKITCEHCNYEETEAIEALGHDWSAWEVVKAATYTEEGLMERVCEVCGEKETKAIPKLVKPSDKPNPGVTDILPGDKAEESNPNTGAPVFEMTAAGIIVLAAALAISGKKRRK